MHFGALTKRLLAWLGGQADSSTRAHSTGPKRARGGLGATERVGDSRPLVLFPTPPPLRHQIRWLLTNRRRTLFTTSRQTPKDPLKPQMATQRRHLFEHRNAGEVNPKWQPKGHDFSTFKGNQVFWIMQMTRNVWLGLEAILFFAQQKPLSSSVHLFIQDRASDTPPRDYREKSMPNCSMCFRTPVWCEIQKSPAFLPLCGGGRARKKQYL